MAVFRLKDDQDTEFYLEYDGDGTLGNPARLKILLVDEDNIPLTFFKDEIIDLETTIDGFIDDLQRVIKELHCSISIIYDNQVTNFSNIYTQLELKLNQLVSTGTGVSFVFDGNDDGDGVIKTLKAVNTHSSNALSVTSPSNEVLVNLNENALLGWITGQNVFATKVELADLDDDLDGKVNNIGSVGDGETIVHQSFNNGYPTLKSLKAAGNNTNSLSVNNTGTTVTYNLNETLILNWIKAQNAFIDDDNAYLTQKLRLWAASVEGFLTTMNYDSDGVITSGTIVWPDLSTGVFTRLVKNSTHLAIDSWSATHVGAALTITQPTVTRDVNGLVTTRPNYTIA